MNSKELNRLAKILDYILGRHPDEFGLIPTPDGYVKQKELLKAINEEPGWRHLRKNHLNELSISHRNPPVELFENSIRAVDRKYLPLPQEPDDLPKLLYTCIRTKAYSIVLEKGLFPRQGQYVILSKKETMAVRVGRRIDSVPIILTINVQKSLQAQTSILSFGKELFLASHIPPECFTGPPLPKEKLSKKETKQPSPPISPPSPGSFFLDLSQNDATSITKKSYKGKKEKGWKEARRKDRRRNKKGYI